MEITKSVQNKKETNGNNEGVRKFFSGVRGGDLKEACLKGTNKFREIRECLTLYKKMVGRYLAGGRRGREG